MSSTRRTSKAPSKIKSLQPTLVLDRMEPEAMALLWHTPLGWGTLGVVAFLEVMGVVVIRKIIAIDV